MALIRRMDPAGRPAPGVRKVVIKRVSSACRRLGPDNCSSNFRFFIFFLYTNAQCRAMNTVNVFDLVPALKPHQSV